MKRALILAAALVLIGQGTVTAETFDLIVFTYCPTTGPSLCGFASQDDYRDFMLDAVQEVNLEWKPVGISFHPIITNIIHDNTYSVSDMCADTPAINALKAQFGTSVGTLFPRSISLMMTPGAKACCSHIPGTPYGDPDLDLFPANYGLYCIPNQNDFLWMSTAIAHELGHHFCLVHTHSFEDPATHNPVNHDFDVQFGISDTPPDPSIREISDPPSSDDDTDPDPGGQPHEGHEWCDEIPVSGLTDDKSPHTTICNPATCHLYSGGTLQTTAFSPDTQLSMSYFGGPCKGPWVLGGVRREAFSVGQSAQIRNVCLTQVPEREDLLDVCGPNGDWDNDGICNGADNCPLDMNTNQQDQDMDGIPDGCDLCPEDPNPTGDMDGDEIGDICDPDMDGDNCDNDEDQHPTQGQVLVGYTFNQSCGFGTEATYESEEADVDGDGVKSCIDVDDDNDGICDDPGPVKPDDPGHPPGGPCQPGPDICLYHAGLGCYAFLNAPADCQPDWFVCLGGGCVEFFMKIVSVINPFDEVIFERFHILNRRIYLPALAGHTASETANAFQGDFAAVGMAMAPAGEYEAASTPGTTALGDPVRVEIWSRRTEERVAVVGEYDATDVMLGEVTRGGWLQLIPTTSGAGGPRLDVVSIYGMSPPEDTFPQGDADRDGRPDIADDCTLSPDFEQMDADGDGYGNACDADIDNDLIVTEADVTAVQDCVGADLTLMSPMSEPTWLGGIITPSPDPSLLELRNRCAAMDLNHDRVVDSIDVSIASQAMGLPPGPSAKAHPETACTPANCDDGKSCTHDYCDATVSQCRHIPGDCDDSDPCTSDACDTVSGECRHEPVSCDDGNICTRDFCDQVAGGCQQVPETGISCDDGDACTSSDLCLDGACVGSPASCNDGDPCTVDSCDPASGRCFFPPTACDDGNPCTSDICSATAGCVYVNETDGAPCSDASLCTQAEQCIGGTCAGVPRDCDDGDTCTSDACDTATGACVNTSLSCDDGDPCTVDECLPGAGGCAHTAVQLPGNAQLEFLGPARLHWTGVLIGDHWNSYRGSIPSSGMGGRFPVYDHVCLESADLVGDGPWMTTDLGLPPVGSGFYYVVSEESECDESPPAFSSTMVPVPIPAPCPTPP